MFYRFWEITFANCCYILYLCLSYALPTACLCGRVTFNNCQFIIIYEHIYHKDHKQIYIYSSNQKIHFPFQIQMLTLTHTNLWKVILQIELWLMFLPKPIAFKSICCALHDFDQFKFAYDFAHRTFFSDSDANNSY